MKRPHPSSSRPTAPSAPPNRRRRRAAAAVAHCLPTILCAVHNAPSAYGKKGPEENAVVDCDAVLSEALGYDADSSGGLDREEFGRFWTDGLGGDSAGVDADDSTFAYMYDGLLCECHYTFGLDVSCCEGGLVADEEGDGTEEPQKWTEVSVSQFGVDKPSKPDKYYHKEFCEWIQWAMEEDGLALQAAGGDNGGDVGGGTTTVVASEAPTAAAEVEEGTTTGASTAATEEPPAEAAVTTSDATETPETTIITTVASTVTTSDATEAPETTTATSSTTAVASTTAAPESTEKFAITFLASANGDADSDTVNVDDVAHAFWRVALDVLARKGSSVGDGRRRNGVRRMQQPAWNYGPEAAIYFEGMVLAVDDVDCPDGLAYAASGTPCLEFTYTLTPLPGGPLSAADDVDEFTADFYTAANVDGELYDALVEDYPDTEIVGMGSPGKGVPYSVPNEESANANKIVHLESGDDTASGESKSVAASSGMPAGGIVGIILAVMLVALLLIGVVFKKNRDRKERLNRSVDDSFLSEDVDANEVNADHAGVEDWLDEEETMSEERKKKEGGAGSSLAAMGVASTVATRLSTGDTEVMITKRQAWSKAEPDV